MLDDENNYLGRVARAKGYEGYRDEQHRHCRRRRRRRWSLCKTARVYANGRRFRVKEPPFFRPTYPNVATFAEDIAKWDLDSCYEINLSTAIM